MFNFMKISKHELKKKRDAVGERALKLNTKPSKFDTTHWAKLEWDNGKAKIALMPTALDEQGNQKPAQIFLELLPKDARKIMSENEINTREEGKAPRWLR